MTRKQTKVKRVLSKVLRTCNKSLKEGLYFAAFMDEQDCILTLELKYENKFIFDLSRFKVNSLLEVFEDHSNEFTRFLIDELSWTTYVWIFVKEDDIHDPVMTINV